MVKTYAVNTFDAWLKSEGDDISESYVKYQDYAALETRLLALLDHPVMKAHTEALREAQITGLAFIRVNANGHVQALPSDRVRLTASASRLSRRSRSAQRQLRTRSAITFGINTWASRSSGSASAAAEWRTFANDIGPVYLGAGAGRTVPASNRDVLYAGGVPGGRP